MTSAPKKRAPKPRPGLRGPGSKPARGRSTAEFSEGFAIASSDTGYARTARRTGEERRKAEREADGRAAAKRAELQAAKDAWINRTATMEQKLLVKKHEDALWYAQKSMAMQSPIDRIHGKGFEWPGGWVVEGKVWRDAFSENGFRTWRHPFFQRMAASMAKASSGNFRTGDTKDGCVRQHFKMAGLDKLYAFFADNCRDVFRLDNEMTFANEAEMRSWLAHRVEETDAPCMPHMVVWIPDSRFPGFIFRPHFYFFLPEGHAVWPKSPDSHHRLLGNVIAALTEAFQCDEGGLAHPFHGKNPISPLTDAVVIRDTHMPTLGEYADHMKLTWDPQLMFRKMSVARLEKAGFDPAQSNTWFSVPSTLATSTARRLFSEGFNVADEDAFEEAIADVITAQVFDLIKPSTEKQIAAIGKMIASCARWSARTFDASKMDAPVKDRGAIAHLIDATDDLKTRRRKGQAYVAANRTSATQATLKPIYKGRIQRGSDHGRTAIENASGRCYNTIKRHEFECTITAIGELLTERCGLVTVKGVHPVLVPIRRRTVPAASLSGPPDGLRPPDSPPPCPEHGQSISLSALQSAHPVPVVAEARRLSTYGLPSAIRQASINSLA